MQNKPNYDGVARFVPLADLVSSQNDVMSAEVI